MVLEMKILLIKSISEAWVETPKWVKWQTEKRKKRRWRESERGKEKGERMWCCGYEDISGTSLTSSDSFSLGWFAPGEFTISNFQYPIFYFQFSISNFLWFLQKISCPPFALSFFSEASSILWFKYNLQSTLINSVVNWEAFLPWMTALFVRFPWCHSSLWRCFNLWCA